ncbi:MAG: hypothetical protein Q9217_001564, partial [Psora testacea]
METRVGEAYINDKQGLETSYLDTAAEAPINPSGHRQELDRNFNLLAICSLAVTSGNTWIAIGGSVTVAIYNGGSPGVLYEFVAVSIFYWLIAASIAELASAMPSSGGVYHWASITGGRHGRIVGWFAGYWNFLAWVFGAAATAQILALQTVSMYAVFHPDFVTKRWHVFVAYLLANILCCSVVLFANKLLPLLETLGGFLIIAGLFITIVICAAMPNVHATDAFVWREWVNSTGYRSNGFVFMLGMLNGAFAVGTPDVVSHLAEEIPRPSKNIPKAILAQFIIGFVTAFTYLIALFYGISDLKTILEGPYLFPLASIYRQITSSASGTVGLLLLSFLPNFISCLGTYLIASRAFWTLARDNATPFAPFFADVSKRHRNPFNAILFCAGISIVLGCIYLGSSTAFSAFVGSFVVLSSLSYLSAILPHLLHRRSGIAPGWFWMKGVTGFAINGVACLYMILFVVIYCFPFSLPVSATAMNY